MRDKQLRIFRAAASLFAERDFESVSTAEIAERADVAAGTVFRYAANKGELLLMAMNDELRQALAAGAERATSRTDTVEAITDIVLPLLEYSARHPGNSRAYQRELLFGDPGNHYRENGLTLVSHLQQAIAERLIHGARVNGLQPDPDQALLVGNMIFGVAHLSVARTSTGAYPERDPIGDIVTHIAIATAGYLAGLSPIPEEGTSDAIHQR